MILKAQVPTTSTHKPKEYQKWRLKLYKLVTSNFFETSIITVIFLNMLQMAVAYEGSTQFVNYFLDLTNYIFTVIFIVEAALKIFVFGWAYFKTGWNRFDFFVVICSIFDIMMTQYQESMQEEMNATDSASSADASSDDSSQAALSAAPQIARVLRVLRVSRVLRIANHHKGL